MNVREVQLHPTQPGLAVADEDQARADWYGLFAALMLTPPGASFLNQLAHAEADRASLLGAAFSDLAAASSRVDQSTVRGEFDQLFLGVGRPEVFLQASFYLTGFLHERPLAQLRGRLAELGLARSEVQSHTEDHLAVLCEVMRKLILERGSSAQSLLAQRELFAEYIGPCVEPLCDAIEEAASSDFYKYVGRVAREFFAVERQAFDFIS